MKISEHIWAQLATYLKSRLLSKYDPAMLVPEAQDLIAKLEMSHQGFYISLYDSKGEKLIRAGSFEKSSNVLHAANRVIEAVFSELEAKGISNKKLPTSSYNFVAVWDLVFIENSLSWDANNDGIYMSWGDRYKGLYLPYEIRQMSVTKAEILNRLCSWELGIPSNLWRLPEGLTYKILCDSYSI